MPVARRLRVALWGLCSVPLLLADAAAWAQAACERPVARLASAEGPVALERPGAAVRLTALDDALCPGDVVRVGPRGRAALALADGGVLRLDQNTTLRVGEAGAAAPSLFGLLTGATHFLSRTRRALEINTPFVNAGVEGTEFLLRVLPDRAALAVYEGRVRFENPLGRVLVAGGQVAEALAGQAPDLLTVVVRPRDAVHWTLYYPPVLTPLVAPGEIPGALPPALAEAVAAAGRGELAAAFERLERVPEAERDATFHTLRAGLLLSVGRADEARADIERALTLRPGVAEALALRAVVAVAQDDDRERALTDARRALELEPDSAAAALALSYALQARFELEEAREVLAAAVGRRQDDPLLRARLAELWLMLGNVGRAHDETRAAAALAPELGRARTALGFVELARIDVDAAEAAFRRAIEREPADPLPHLGLGLALIRRGDLAAGRREIEIAAGLDSNDALLRSYLGKAYFEERDDATAAQAFATAKALDPNDPTPWFYDAIRKQLANQPVAALQDLETAITLNDNRAVYRSRLLLDDDLAARSASLARIYNDLGFEQLALLEGWKSVNVDPGNYSSHRFLADAYAALPRHEIARVSELLQSQLRQPLNVTPIQPQLAESDLGIIAETGPSVVGFSEFHPLFLRNGASVLVDGVVGSNDTWGNDFIVSGIKDALSFSVGQFHYQSDGFRPNNDLDEDIINAFFQIQLTPSSSLQAEVRRADFERGDLPLRFDPENFFRNLRQEDRIDSLRFGFRHAFSPHSDLIASLQLQRAEFDAAFRDVSAVDRDEDGRQLELQYLHEWPRVTLLSGAGRATVDRETSLRVVGLPELPTTEEDIVHDNLYAYSYTALGEAVQLTLGASADFLEGATVDRDQLNPKLGAIWTPRPGTTVRAAAFRALKRTLISSQTIEPTQVAGFNQFFDDTEAADAWRYGIGVDQSLSGLAGLPLYAGVELSHRDLDVPALIPPPAPAIVQEDFDEDLARVYLGLAPHPWWAFNGEYAYERFKRDVDLVGPEDFTEIRTHRFSLGARLAHPSGLRASVTGTYVAQEGEFGAAGGGIEAGDDRFWVFDVSAGYWLPNRRGLISLLARNVFDQDFRFQDTDPTRPRIIPERQILLRASLFF